MQKLLSKIPKVSLIIEDESCQELIATYSHDLIVKKVREYLAKLREDILAGGEVAAKELEIPVLIKAVKKDLAQEKFALAPVVNATGVIIHTNLGRSLLSEKAQQAVLEVADNYSTLEIDAISGERGSRYNNVQQIIEELTGAEDCLIVNNNAAAVLLTLSTMAQGKEVIISRGQLVEIGGSFRIPDVMERSGAKLVEVGSTNKVHLRDYKAAISEDTGLIMKVHTSNYKVVGFSKEVAGSQLAQLAQEHDIPMVEDLGSGIFVDLREYGLSYEPTVQDVVKEDIDLITFSGDKLLGGPQAGIIVGKKEYIEQMKSNPLTRAIRVDKFTLAALEATLKEYRDKKQALKKIPTLKMLTESKKKVKDRAENLLADLKSLQLDKLKFELKPGISRVGGGSFPLEELASFLISVEHNDLSSNQLAKKLRLNYPSVFTRIAEGEVLLDMRTVREKELVVVKEAVRAVNSE